MVRDLGKCPRNHSFFNSSYEKEEEQQNKYKQCKKKKFSKLRNYKIPWEKNQ